MFAGRWFPARLQFLVPSVSYRQFRDGVEPTECRTMTHQNWCVMHRI